MSVDPPAGNVADGPSIRPGPEQELAELARADLLRTLGRFDSRGGRVLVTGAREVGASSDDKLIDFASNDYLGLARNAAVNEAVAEGLRMFPGGAAASRLICGGSGAHEALEARLAGFKQTEAALLFGSGFAAASGALPALVGRDDFVLLDKLSHACLIDGARLSGATMRVFPHQGLDKLDELLAWCRRRAKPGARLLIVTESVFSMDGDQTDLPALVEIKRRHDALLMLDEAHAIGVIGPSGRGLAAVHGLQQEVDFHMGTLSKAVGLSGGYIAARRVWIDLLINRARSFIFSTAPPPALAWGALKALDLVEGEVGDGLRAALQERLRQLRGLLHEAGISTDSAPIRTPTEWPQDRGGGVSAVVPLLTGDTGRALQLARSLGEAGHLVPAIRYPTVPRNAARLRLSLSAVHEPVQIEALVTDLRRALEAGGGPARDLAGQG